MGKSEDCYWTQLRKIIKGLFTKMMSRTCFRLVHRVAARAMSTEAVPEVATSVKLNFSLPHETIYSGASVYRVIIPGVEGDYGVGANHEPIVAQLKPGVLQIIHDESNLNDPEKYFVAGGIAMTHTNSTTVRLGYELLVFLWSTTSSNGEFFFSIPGCVMSRSGQIGQFG